MAEHFRILTLNSISHAGLKLLPAERYEVGSHLERPDAILVRSARHAQMDDPDIGAGDRSRRGRHQQHSRGRR